MDSIDEAEQRAAARFETSLPLVLEGTLGEVHNISTQGIYFETDVWQQPGELVNFTVEYRLYGRRHRLLCEGKIVRVQRQGQRMGVAARLVTPFFEGAEEVTL
jgi:hypothetical protein